MPNVDADRMWLEERFRGLQASIQSISDKLTTLDAVLLRCRSHCDDTTSKVWDDLEQLKRVTATNKATGDLRLELEQKFAERDAQRKEQEISGRHVYWIKMGAIITASLVLSGMVQFLFEHWMKVAR